MQNQQRSGNVSRETDKPELKIKIQDRVGRFVERFFAIKRTAAFWAGRGLPM
jgi:hypothetical protein